MEQLEKSHSNITVEKSLTHRNDEGLEVTKELGVGRGSPLGPGGLVGKAKEIVKVSSCFAVPTSPS